MSKVYYNKDGWVCNRFPYNIELDDETRFIEVDDEMYKQTFSCGVHYAWRVVNGLLSMELFEDIPESEVLDRLRDIRQRECFDIINRGSLWYSTLTVEQTQELKVWYQKWLDITKDYQKGIDIETFIPEKPKWLK